MRTRLEELTVIETPMGEPEFRTVWSIYCIQRFDFAEKTSYPA
ncbi:hypothetical protein RRSWK_02945 [Rhodopirellula sp. SWK7]|nr:hypothetical protein RRSWK_02945 [Rhodopirellula sp. SWK7]